MKNNFYVYEWFNTNTNEVFYVGKGKNKRYKNTTKRNEYFKNYYNKYDCDVRKIKTNLTENESFDLEKELIKHYKEIGQCMCNLTEGGEGCTFPEDTWNHWFRKIQYLHDVKGAMDDMPNEKDYDPAVLKTKSLDELKDMYKNYTEYREGVKTAKYLGLNKKLDGYELKMQNEELVWLTQIISNGIAKNHNEFKDFLDFKKEIDFICCSFNTDKFLKLIIEKRDYFYKLAEVLVYVLEFMKVIQNSPDLKVPVSIKSHYVEGNYLYIRCKDDNSKTKRVKINLCDIIWGILMWKDKPLFEILYKEIISSPIVSL